MPKIQNKAFATTTTRDGSVFHVDLSPLTVLSIVSHVMGIALEEIPADASRMVRADEGLRVSYDARLTPTFEAKQADEARLKKWEESLSPADKAAKEAKRVAALAAWRAANPEKAREYDARHAKRG